MDEKSIDLGSITTRCSRKSTGALKTLSSCTSPLTRETTLSLLWYREKVDQKEKEKMTATA